MPDTLRGPEHVTPGASHQKNRDDAPDAQRLRILRRYESVLWNDYVLDASHGRDDVSEESDRLMRIGYAKMLLRMPEKFPAAAADGTAAPQVDFQGSTSAAVSLWAQDAGEAEAEGSVQDFDKLGLYPRAADGERLSTERRLWLLRRALILLDFSSPNGRHYHLQADAVGRGEISSPPLHDLRVRDSTIAAAGKGLFTTRKIVKGDWICVYFGTVLNLGQLMKATILADSKKSADPAPSEKPLSTDYLLGGFGLFSVDGEHPDPHGNLCLGRWVNDWDGPRTARGEDDVAKRTNVAFLKSRSLKRAVLVALRDLDPGEELFAEYGSSYWKKRLSPA